jgi:hypothetical protein
VAKVWALVVIVSFNLSKSWVLSNKLFTPNAAFRTFNACVSASCILIKSSVSLVNNPTTPDNA